MKTQLPAVAAAAVVLVASLWQGRWTGRWGLSEELEASPERLARVPSTFGDWNGQDIVMSDEKKAEFKKAQIVGHLLRQYIDAKTGDSLTVLVVSGLPGPIATHGPETCFKGTGYELQDAARKLTVPAGPGEKPATFWAGEFRKHDATLAPALWAAWSWSGREKWDAADDPRTAFANCPCLYKVYLIREMPLFDGMDPDDPAVQASLDAPALRFMKAFRLALDAALFDSPAPPRHATSGPAYSSWFRS